jgi:hypothetical protein
MARSLSSSVYFELDGKQSTDRRLKRRKEVTEQRWRTSRTLPSRARSSPLLAKIREVGVPSKVTVQWLKTVGFRSSNDASLLGVLKHIGFTDASGVPSSAWTQYRGANHQKVLGDALRGGYAELFAVYPGQYIQVACGTRGICSGERANRPSHVIWPTSHPSSAAGGVTSTCRRWPSAPYRRSDPHLSRGIC